MPKIIGYTPPFLSRPSPGSKIFTDPEPQSPASPSKRSSYIGALPSTQYQGPRRLLAGRGTEIFTVVGNKIRWADLTTVRDEWEDSTQSGASQFGPPRSDATEATADSVYRTLAVPVYYQIRQISISPSGLFLAICTEHTVHIAVLPDPSRLKEHDRSPLKVKTYQLGPTVHVIPESPLASVLWHPLAYATASTDCLVTVTSEAAVRVWEFDKANSWSLDRPKLAIDLRKLADGVSCDQDFEPSGFGKTRGFSVDDFDMEVSAACFGGRGREDEDAWAAMTLWIAMRNGDLYALCPLLPSRWKPTSTTIPSLTTTAVSRMASINDEETDMDERRAADQQYEWVQEIDNEEAQIHQSTDSLGEFEIRLRPQNPSAIPRLQGPFTIVPEEDATEIEVSDIHVFPAKLDEQALFDGDDDDEIDPGLVQPIPFTTISVATPENQVWFAIDLDGVTGQWLPKKGKSAFGVPSSDAKPLTLIDIVTLDEPTTDPAANWPVFTPDIVHNYSLFLTTLKRVYSLSLNDWVSHLGAELTGTEPVDPGLRTRLSIQCRSQVCVTDQLIESREPSEALCAPAIIDDTSLGYLLLTATLNGPYGVIFDQAHLGTSNIGPSITDFSVSSGRLESQLAKRPVSPIETVPVREPYCPPKIFYFNQHIPIDSMRQRLPPYLKKAISDRPMRLSPAMLEIMTFTHRTISVQSAQLENAAAELFRRCERLRIELAGQVKQMTELAQQLQRLTATTEEDENGNVKEKMTPETRISEARERQSKLTARYEALRRKVGRVGSANRELGSKELAWMHEIEILGKNVGIVSKEDGEQEGSERGTTLDKRFETVKQLTSSLVKEAHAAEKQQQPASPKGPPALEASVSSISASSITPSMSASQITVTSRSSGAAASPRSSTFGGLGVSSRLQKERIADIMATVEREGAVIEAAMKRLERLRMEY
ncbi:uncharacterized protein Z519_05904 [Cladophialophora bantiana CBS 173.52]|uniref:Nuclear pore complex protein An-Nup82 n=1 Tax=Cladophialophora bantiana (strain ATCC 10958 / CBS 173.52 / CDC B-1940 / NIH 8579) TaxID=1442370 RepID=A0A0D2I945_CLAB1|nr:uncharacterized protein Z519_05904 [Cladophialophora bantiana CBS 173.52]KIW93299.1 hypothetical protein Z519_05904 [Cladophialophora bantiana CBS 173.52]